jgi:WD40 repeat protein
MSGTGQLIRSSADGAHLYGADLNPSGSTVYSINPSTYAVQQESLGFLFWTDLAVSADGSQFAVVDAPPFVDGSNVGFFDSQLRYRNTIVYPDLSPPDDTGVLGIAFSPGGKVLVVPMGDSLELWDTATGFLRGIAKTCFYPEGAAAPALAIDAGGQTLFALSTSGLTVLTLSQPWTNCLSCSGHNRRVPVAYLSKPERSLPAWLPGTTSLRKR